MSQAHEIRAMETPEILKALEESKRELFNLRFQRAAGQLENPRRITIVKRTIARYKTILRERDMALMLARQDEEESN
jgi:large subunit ribosomal protein L29